MPQAAEATEQETVQPRKRRRLIDYPRRGRQGMRRWLPSWRLSLGLLFVGVTLLVTGFFVALGLVRIPQPNDFATRQASIFEYSDGRTQIAHIGMNRVSVPLTKIPDTVRHAVLAAEDRSFYSESAVSPTGILRALKNDVTSGGGSLQGGSTITQQYVKNYYLTEQQTFGRKAEEALVAIKIDQQQSKDTILQNYLNTVFFARSSYGVEAAARTYFGEDVWQLANQPAKAAYLAALVQQPYYFGTADTDPAAATALRARWNYVLDGMVTEHWLAKGVRDKLTFPVPVKESGNQLAGQNGYLVTAAMNYLDQAHEQNPAVPDASVIGRGGYTVVTTFRQQDMTNAGRAVQATMASLDPKHNPADRNVHIGLAAIDPSTGAVTAIYGGSDYVTRGYDDATQAAGPTGSGVATTLADGVDAQPDDNWPTAIKDLRRLGITDANPKDNPPTDDDITATPLAAAVAFQATVNRGIAYQPFEVQEVRYQGQVVWRATPTALGFPNGSRVPETMALTSGSDGSDEWTWAVGGGQGLALAVDMYATKPNGTTNRPLTGMTPTVTSVIHTLTAQQKVTQTALTYMSQTTKRATAAGNR